MMDLRTLTNVAGGTLSEHGCRLLFEIAGQVPEDGVIFDVYSGEGRSTIAMATALEDGEHGQARIVAIDTHVVNPMSMTPYEDGTIMKFLGHLRKFRVGHRVHTLIAPENGMLVFNRRSANLIVIQAPSCQVAIDDVMRESIAKAKEAIRTRGRIVVVQPPHVDTQAFRRFITSQLGIEYKAEPLDFGQSYLYVYESGGLK